MIRNLIIQVARDTGWGYRRILGELKKLRIVSISRSAAARILQENRVKLGPNRVPGTWHDFVQRHVKTLWSTDFLTKNVWTLRGPVTYYVLFFVQQIQIERIWRRGGQVMQICGGVAEPKVRAS